MGSRRSGCHQDQRGVWGSERNVFKPQDEDHVSVCDGIGQYRRINGYAAGCPLMTPASILIKFIFDNLKSRP